MPGRKGKVEMFRLLNAEEIECRVSTVSEKGLSLLLYKDARADQRILDETVGPMNWQRFHTRENANCIVQIWDAEKDQWISKEDTGTESFTEKEKGLASDSFKRACFNWGIGRELYTAPFIWVSADKCKIDPKGGGKFTTYDKFEVDAISYDKNRNVESLKIKNAKTGAVVYSKGTREANKPTKQPPKSKTGATDTPAKETPKKAVKNEMTDIQRGKLIQKIVAVYEEQGKNITVITKHYKVDLMEDLTDAQLVQVFDKVVPAE